MEQSEIIDKLTKFNEDFSKFVISIKKILFNRDLILHSVNQLEKTNIKNKLTLEFAPKYLQIGNYSNRVLLQIQSNNELQKKLNKNIFQIFYSKL